MKLVEWLSNIKILNGIIVLSVVLIVFGGSYNSWLFFIGLALCIAMVRLKKMVKTDGNLNNFKVNFSWNSVLIVVILLLQVKFYSALFLGDTANSASFLYTSLFVVFMIPTYIITEQYYAKKIKEKMFAKSESELGVEETKNLPLNEQLSTNKPLGFSIHSAEANAELLNSKSKEIYDIALNKHGHNLFIGLLIALFINMALYYIYFIIVWDALYKPNIPLTPNLQLVINLSFMTVGFFVSAVVAYYIDLKRNGIHWAMTFIIGLMANSGSLLWLAAIYDSNKITADQRHGVFLPILAYMVIMLIFIIRYFIRMKMSPISRFIDNGGIRLTVLRVFGVKNSTNSIFTGIGSRWQHIGPLMTIVDWTFAVFEFRKKQFIFTIIATVPIVIFFLVTITNLDGWRNPNYYLGMLNVFVFIYFPLYIAFVIQQLVGINNRFSQNKTALVSRLAFETKGEEMLADRYQQGTMYCYDNLWQVALKEMTGNTDVILMDLRNFNAQNMGCKYEINYLLNHFPLNRTVFLIDNATDRNFLEHTVENHWANLNPLSINCNTDNPLINLFVDERRGKMDLDNLTAILCNIVSDLRTSNSDAEVLLNTIPNTNGEKIKLTKITPSKINKAIVFGWGLVVLGFIIQIIIFNYSENNNLDSNSTKFKGIGLSIAWLGGIILMLFTRYKMLLQRDGNFSRLFKGFPWPVIFWIATLSWIISWF